MHAAAPEPGGLAGCVERTSESSGRLYGWAERSEFATPFVADPAKRSLVVGRAAIARDRGRAIAQMAIS